VSYLIAAYAVTGVTLGVYAVLLLRELRRLRGRSGA
jgi:CcmD family protein